MTENGPQSHVTPKKNPFALNEWEWILKKRLICVMDPVDIIRFSFLSERSRQFVEGCKFKAENFEIYFGDDIRIVILCGDGRKVEMKLFEKIPEVIGAEVNDTLRGRGGKKVKKPAYTNVQNWIQHCFSVFTHEHIGIIVEEYCSNFSLRELKQIIKRMDPSHEFSWTRSSFASKSLNNADFNRILTLRSNVFGELHPILALPTNCITIGNVLREDSFKGLELFHLFDVDTYALRIFGSTVTVVYWNRFVKGWSKGLFGGIEKMFVWHPSGFDNQELREIMHNGNQDFIVENREMDEDIVKNIAGYDTPIHLNFYTRIINDDGTKKAEITMMTSPMLGSGFSFKVCDKADVTE